MTPTRVVVLLSGGGAKSAAHVGALRALGEAGLAPSHYVGTSMGAVIAAAAAAGLDPEAMLERMARIERRHVAAPARLAVLGGLYLPALLRPDPFRRTIGTLIPAVSFADLKVPLTVTAVDLDSGELALFGAGGREVPLAEALYASCALPLFYPPGEIGGRRYADGGLHGAVPFEAAESMFTTGPLGADLVVAVDIGPGFDLLAIPAGARTLPRMVQAHADATGILMASVTRAQLALWRARSELPPLLYVRPKVERDATFAVERLAVYADEGYRAAGAALEEWRRR